MLSSRLLDGVRVLDFTRIIAGPYATRTLADFGADVIKIEAPHEGDHTRSEVPGGKNVRYYSYNYGKKSVALDLKHPDGREAILRLASICDVVVENFRPDVLDRLRLGYDDLSAVNPGIIYCGISGWGKDSPNAKRPMHASMAHAVSGIMGLQPSLPVRSLPSSLADPVSAVHAVAAICASLYWREKSGLGQYIDLALVDVMVSMGGPWAEYLSFQGGRQRPTEAGDRSTTTVPVGLFECKGGYLQLGGGVENPQWQRLAIAVGRPDLAEKPHTWRRANAAEVYGAIEDFLDQQPSAAAAEKLLADAGVVVGRVRTPDEALSDPALRHRGMVGEMIDPVVGRVETTSLPYRFSRTPQKPQGIPPALGEQTRGVLRDYLGYDESRINAMFASGAAYAEPWPL